MDAGYLYAQGGKLCCGSAKRDRVRLSPSDARDFLADLAFRATGVPVLRIYWYDGARDGIPTTEQQIIAALSNVKPLDVDLLGAAEAAIGRSLRGQDQLRRGARRAFWDRIGTGTKEHG